MQKANTKLHPAQEGIQNKSPHSFEIIVISFHSRKSTYHYPGVSFLSKTICFISRQQQPIMYDLLFSRWQSRKTIFCVCYLQKKAKPYNHLPSMLFLVVFRYHSMVRCFMCASNTPRTLRACCSLSEFGKTQNTRKKRVCIIFAQLHSKHLTCARVQRTVHSYAHRIDSFTFRVILFC